MKYLVLLLFSFTSFASSLHLDVGKTETNFNGFAIPNNRASELAMPTAGDLTGYRLTAYYDLPSKNQLYVLLAPLEASYNLTSIGAFTFNNTSFAGSTATKVDYRFNSWRVGYLWTWVRGTLKYWLGAVGKIRDAEIKVTQGASSDSYDNVGFVPLASFGFEWALSSNFGIFSHTDAMSASQGSAYDSSVELKFKTGRYGLSIGKRVLGGGVDNDSVYNFAQFDTFYLRLSGEF